MAAAVGLPSSGNDCSRMGGSLSTNGFLQLSPTMQHEIARHIRALADWQDGPVTCPFLAATHGPYLVYDHCPAAYRMYGFYVSHTNHWRCTDTK